MGLSFKLYYTIYSDYDYLNTESCSAEDETKDERDDGEKTKPTFWTSVHLKLIKLLLTEKECFLRTQKPCLYLNSITKYGMRINNNVVCKQTN